jgi:hypothetical protein
LRGCIHNWQFPARIAGWGLLAEKVRDMRHGVMTEERDRFGFINNPRSGSAKLGGSKGKTFWKEPPQV